MPDNECVHCKKTEGQASLHKCPICFKYYCGEHAYQLSGRTFCSQPCAEYFFFSDPDD
jgi:hypothetical protein